MLGALLLQTPFLVGFVFRCNVSISHSFPACEDGKYGVNCASKCGACKPGTTCDKSTGHCPEGCAKNFFGDLCIDSKSILFS